MSNTIKIKTAGRLSAGPEYRTPISFYVMMGGLIFGLLLSLVVSFFV